MGDGQADDDNDDLIKSLTSRYETVKIKVKTKKCRRTVYFLSQVDKYKIFL